MPKQHKNATTTPEMRAFIHESDLATAVLARLLKVSESTVRKWRRRASTDDASHIPRQLNTTLSPAQQYVVVQLRIRFKLSLDELLAVCRQFINANVSRAGLQRCLKRHGVSRLADMDSFDESENSENYVQVAVEENLSCEVLNSVISPQGMSDFLNQMRQQLAQQGGKQVPESMNCELSSLDVVQVYLIPLPEFSPQKQEQKSKQQRLLMAHDPDSCWIYVDLYDDDEYQAAQRYIRYVLKKAPFHVRRLLVRNYNEFLSRFRLLDKKSSRLKTSENAHKS
ncbi:transcriptional regulator [Psychromonas aquimarina]|uniref:transcriptional regulator n=1 Tax=Psychromonas aquimarina TaxID=444919 RepID=UPI0003FDD658|nr:transcriptional regulator [Psychromonas aquimarina]